MKCWSKSKPTKWCSRSWRPPTARCSQIVKAVGDTVLSEEVVGLFAEGATAASPTPAKAAAATARPAAESAQRTAAPVEREAASVSPAARKLAAEQGVALGRVDGTGKDGRVTKEDVLRAAAQKPARTRSAACTDDFAAESCGRIRCAGGAARADDAAARQHRASAGRGAAHRRDADDLQRGRHAGGHDAANPIQGRIREASQRHRLGFMSFFVRASVEALKRFPAVNASIDETDIVYHGYYDIGVAVSTDRGLVVPVVRDADALGLAQIEEQIRVYGTKARDGKLTIEDMTGGTFTISNGGVFGSLMSTPILNPPQTAILGMHKIQERPVVLDGQIVVRPMMYLALSYDHRLIDGQEAVRFLVTIKELLEDPARILLDL